jgi:hypothetical protein
LAEVIQAEPEAAGLLSEYLQAMGIDRWTERGSSVAPVIASNPSSAVPSAAETATTSTSGQTFHVLNFQSLAMLVGVDQHESEVLPEALLGMCYELARAYNRAPSRPVVSVLGMQRNKAPEEFIAALSQLLSGMPRQIIVIMDVQAKISEHANNVLDLLASRNGDHLVIDNLIEFQTSAALKRKLWEDLMASRVRPRGD